MPTVHPNYIKASNIAIIQLAIALVSYFLYFNDLHIRHKMLAPIGMIIVFSFLIYLVRVGNPWMKYFLLLCFAIANCKPAKWETIFTHGPLKIIGAIVAIGVSIWQLWLLFTVPNQEASSKKGPDNPGPEIV